MCSNLCAMVLLTILCKLIRCVVVLLLLIYICLLHRMVIRWVSFRQRFRQCPPSMSSVDSHDDVASDEETRWKGVCNPMSCAWPQLLQANRTLRHSLVHSTFRCLPSFLFRRRKLASSYCCKGTHKVSSSTSSALSTYHFTRQLQPHPCFEHI